MNRPLWRMPLADWLLIAWLAGACTAPTGESTPGAAPGQEGVRPASSGGVTTPPPAPPTAIVAATAPELKPLAKPSSGGATLLTPLAPEATGIVHQNHLPFEFSGRYLYVGAGVAAGDYDNDGLPDLYLVSEASPSKLYHNRGGWKFEDVTAQAGLDIDRTKESGRWSRRFPMGAYWLDYDGDKDLDMFLTVFAGANALFRNNGDGTFTEVTQAAGLAYAGGSTTAAVADYDRDGDLDLYVATYRPYGDTKFYPPGSAAGLEPELYYDTEGSRLLPEPDLLYQNQGDGTFKEVSRAAGVGGTRDWGLSAGFGDVNNDGWPDLYVANDFESPDRFFLNNRDGSFQPVPNNAYRHTPFFSMGMDFGDVNNDGWLDFMTSDMLSPDRVRRMSQVMADMMDPHAGPPAGSAPQLMRNALQINNQDGTFSDVAPFAGVTATDWTWSIKFVDVDLDGLEDVLVTNGFTLDTMNADVRNQAKMMTTEERVAFMKTLPPLLTPNIAFHNLGGLRFEEVAGQWGFNSPAMAHGLAVADFDGDGDPDFVVNQMNAPAAVYRNDAAASRLKVRLKAGGSNADAVGARVTIEDANGRQMRVVSLTGGYLSGHEAVAFFGLGSGATVKKLTVAWPSGRVSEATNLPANRAVTLSEPSGEVQIPAPPTAVPTQFEEVAAALGITYTHTESPFNDFAVQPLLPHKLSQYGPGVAWGDQDGDGYDDLYFAGSNGHAGALFVNKGGRAFEPAPPPALPAPGREEQAVLWWPAGGHAMGLVASLSSVEAPSTAGAGPIARQLDAALAPTSWAPASPSSGGPLAAADYNGDGELDLFVGGRVNPGHWPLATASHLFKGGAGGLAAADVDAPGLAEVGMVAGALWSDTDDDKDPDLLLATELGPVKLFRNDGGKLVDATAAAGLDRYVGWWNGLAASDVDHDGDIDFVATNLGLNTPYKATGQEPVVLYAGDADGDGNTDVVAGEWDGGKLYLARQHHELEEDVPSLVSRYATYGDLVSTTVDAFLGDTMGRLKRFEANWPAHAVFLNDGQGRFTATPLPTEAQLGNGYGVVLADLDNDGHDDIYMVGNFYGTEEMHLGQLDGSVSAWLKGDGKGGFASVPVVRSGLSVPFDAKGLAASDFDQDGWVDLAVGVNNGRAMLFHNQGVPGRKGLTIRLAGGPQNPMAAGARITVTRADGLMMTREVAAGSSFLSASGGVHNFGLGDEGGAARVTVRWPDGSEKTVDGAAAGQVVTIGR